MHKAIITLCMDFSLQHFSKYFIEIFKMCQKMYAKLTPVEIVGYEVDEAGSLLA